jgi:hypothetical protein
MTRQQRRAAERALRKSLRRDQARVFSRTADGTPSAEFWFEWPADLVGDGEVMAALAARPMRKEDGFVYADGDRMTDDGRRVVRVTTVRFPHPFDDLLIASGERLTEDKARRLLEAVRALVR